MKNPKDKIKKTEYIDKLKAKAEKYELYPKEVQELLLYLLDKIDKLKK